MTTAELLQYLRDYLHTTDSGTIARCADFLAIAAGRVRSRCTGVLIETLASFTPAGSQTLPAGFIAVRSISVSGLPLTWITPDQFDASLTLNEPATDQGPMFYTIKANTLFIWPTPAGTDTGSWDFYAIDGNNLGANNAMAEILPSCLLRGAASEAYRWEGDQESAASEEQGFAAEIEALNDARFIRHGDLSVAGI